MSPAKITLYKPQFTQYFLRPGEHYTYGAHEFVATEDGFYIEEFENDSGYTIPRRDYVYSDRQNACELQDGLGGSAYKSIRVEAVPMSDLPK